MKTKPALLNQIPLYPTEFSVDVWVCKSKETLAECYHKRYGASVDYYREELKPNAVWSLTATKDSELKRYSIIVMNIESFNYPVIVHEINHVIFHLAKYCNVEINYESQEWVSCMLEYLFKHCTDKKSFEAYQV